MIQLKVCMPSDLKGLRAALKWIDKHKRSAFKDCTIDVYSDQYGLVEVSVIHKQYTDKRRKMFDKAANQNPVTGYIISSSL